MTLSSTIRFTWKLLISLVVYCLTLLYAELLDVLPGKRKPADGGYLSDEGEEVQAFVLSDCLGCY